MKLLGVQLDLLYPWVVCMYVYAGTKLGIFKGRGPINRKGAVERLKEDTAFTTVFQTHERRKTFGRPTDIVVLKANDSYCHFL